MKKFIVSLALILIALVFSYYTSVYWGQMYTSIFGSDTAWIGSEQSWNSLIGFSLAPFFFFPIFAYPWIFKSWKKVFWLLSPFILWELTVDLRHIYIPFLLVLVGFGLSKIIHLLASKLRRPNQPIVVK